MRILNTILLVSILGFFNITLAQTKVEKGYFMFPINPGQTNYLAGSMGELRSNHFHAGIDIKTGGQTGLPVKCSADGYISRIKISTLGYGRTLYVTHPNGLTTVYAHLDQYNDTIAFWALKKQYELLSFDIDVYPQPNEIRVKKGQTIAYSGNTGSSGGPHLHYEIRDERENIWNPLLFGFKEIKDNLPPIFESVAVRTFDIGSLVENEFGRKDFTPLKSGNNYTITKPINAIGTIGIEVKTSDKMNDTHNKYGITCLDVKVNGKETFFHNLNTFSFVDGKKINAHIDYETLVNRNQRFQRCYISDGNTLASYKQNNHNGQLKIEVGQSYKVEITIYDAYSNTSTLTFTIDGKEPNRNVVSTDITKGGYRIFENILKIKSKTIVDTTAQIYLKGLKTNLMSAYLVNKYPIYLYDLRKGLPDSIQIGSYVEKFDFCVMLTPGASYDVKHENFSIRFSDTSLIDTLYLQLNCIKDPSGKHCLNIHDPSYPVFGKINVCYKPDAGEIIHPNSYLALNGRKYEDSKINEDGLIAETKYLGKFVIVKDTLRPVVKYLSHTTKTIKFNIFDTGSGIDSIKASIDGKWLLMNYEHKKKIIWSENLDKNKPLKGKFLLEITDKAGNVTRFEKIL